MAGAALGSNPIHCLRCNLEIPLEQLDLDDALVDAIADWRSTYQAIDVLELASGPYEGWARAQLLNAGSPPNADGLAVNKRLNARFRCYFWFWQAEADMGFRPRSTCPVCRGPLDRSDAGIFPQRLCEQDRVVLVGG